MDEGIVLEKLLRQDRAIVVVGTAAIALLGWAYLFYQGWACNTWTSLRWPCQAPAHGA